jgi:hypothetical protein
MTTDRAVDLVATELESPLSPEDIAIRHRVVQMIDDHLDTIVGLTATSLHACEPVFRSRIASGEMHMEKEKSIEEGLKAYLLPREDKVSTTGWPGRIGRSRAQQGVPLAAMRRGYHIAGQVLFGVFMEWVAEEKLPRERFQALADDIWYSVALHSDAATTAFRVAEIEIFGGRQAGDLLDALFNGDTDPDCVAGVALAWGLAVQARYAVVVQRLADWGAPPLTRAELPSEVAGTRVVWRMYEACAIGVAALGDTSATAFAAELPTRPGRRTGVSLAVNSLAELGHGRRLAELAAHTVTTAGGTTCLDEQLPADLLDARLDPTTEPFVQVLMPVLALDQVSRDRLLDALTAWVAAGGSAQRAAASLFCHRNTILNRIRRLEHLTGKSLSVPKDLAELTLAIEEFRMRNRGS